MFLLTFACGVVGSAVLPTAAGGQQQRQQCRERRHDPDERAADRAIVKGNGDAAVADRATLLLTPSRLQAAPGSRLRLTLSILGADDVRRLPVTIRFDPDVIELVSVGLGSAWNDRPQPVLLHDASRPGELVIGLGQLDKTKRGISGVAELLELEFLALAPGNAGIVIERFAAISDGARAQATIAFAADIVVQ
jgi:hypothetical protein